MDVDTKLYTLTVPNYSTNLLVELNTLRTNNICCDVKICTDDGDLYAHKIVLCSVSPYFKERLTLSSNEQDTIDLQDTSQHLLQCVINFVYTGVLQFESIYLDKMVQLINKLEIKETTVILDGLGKGESCGRSQSDYDLCGTTFEDVTSERRETGVNTQLGTDTMGNFVNINDGVQLGEKGTGNNDAGEKSVEGNILLGGLSVENGGNLAETSMRNESNSIEKPTNVGMNDDEVSRKRKAYDSDTDIEEADMLEQLSNVSEELIDYYCAIADQSSMYKKAQRTKSKNSDERTENEPNDVAETSKDSEIAKADTNMQNKSVKVNIKKTRKPIDKPPRKTPKKKLKANVVVKKEQTDTNNETLDDNVDRSQNDALFENIEGFQIKVEPEDASDDNKPLADLKKKTSKRGKYQPSTKPKQCKVCDEVLPNYQAFLVHRKTHGVVKKKRIRKPFPCSVCDRILSSARDKLSHEYSKHGIVNNNMKLHACTVEGCTYVAGHKRYLETHMLGVHNEERPHICEYCGKGFKMASGLWTHMNIHTHLKEYKCPECDMKFHQQSGLEIHKLRYHKEQQSWPELCHLCSENFLKKSDLCWHLFTVHDIPLPDNYTLHSCDICDYKTLKREQIERHRNSHKGERKWICSVCGKNFLTKNYLRRHMSFHGEKSHVCEYPGCDFATADKFGLKSHIKRMHTEKYEKPWACSLCKYRTGIRGNLDKHIRQTHKLEVVTKHTVQLKVKFKDREAGDIITKDGQLVQSAKERSETVKMRKIPGLEQGVDKQDSEDGDLQDSVDNSEDRELQDSVDLDQNMYTMSDIDIHDQSTSDKDIHEELTSDSDIYEQPMSDVDSLEDPMSDVDISKESTYYVVINKESTSDLDSLEESASDLDIHKVSISDEDINKESTLDLYIHKESTSDLHTHKESTSDLHTHKESTSDLHTHKESTSDLHTHKESTSDLDIHKESMSDVDINKELTSDLCVDKESMSDVDINKESTSDSDIHEDLTSDLDNHKESMSDVDTQEESTSNVDINNESKSDVTIHKESKTGVVMNKESKSDKGIQDVTKRRGNFTCSICDASYTNKSNLNRHFKIHDKRFKFECTKCTQFFKSEDDLAAHNEAKHSIKQHLCSFCGQSFQKKSHLLEHQRRLHEASTSWEPSFICPFENCKKLFVQKDKYNDHLNVHKGLKPHSCASCDKRFHSKYYKNIHEKMCIGEIKPQCDICGLTYSDRSSLKRHKDSKHGDQKFICHCGKIFKYKWTLTKHQKNRH